MRICIIGHFGGGKTFVDGQTVKTVTLYKALKSRNIEIEKVDTYYVRRNPVRFAGLFLKSLFTCRKYIILLSKNGRRILFPVLAWCSWLLHKEIYHYAIGGRLALEASENTRWKVYLNSFRSNWVESVEVTDRLQELGVRNAVYLPNFKKLAILSPDELPRTYQEPFRFCTFSRVMREKGIEDAIAAVREINKKYGREAVTLDIYGPVEKGYEAAFEKVIGRESRYCGVIPANESVGALKNYYALLFPTHWRHEGIPGTIIDALSAGVPVIARRWQYCDEMLQHKVTGYIYDFEQPEQLVNRIEYAISHVAETMEMKPNCLERAKLYSEDYVIRYITQQMGQTKLLTPEANGL